MDSEGSDSGSDSEEKYEENKIDPDEEIPTAENLLSNFCAKNIKMSATCARIVKVEPIFSAKNVKISLAKST